MLSGTSLRSLILYDEILLVQHFHVKVEPTPRDLVSCFTTQRYLQSNDILLLNNGKPILSVSFVQTFSDNV